MRLSIKPLVNWANVNLYSFANQWDVRSGDPITLYFQLIDLDQAMASPVGSSLFSGITPVAPTAGLRYLLGVGSANQPYSVTVTFMSIDQDQLIAVPAVQADPNDSSIWKVSLSPLQLISGGNVQFAVTEGSNTYRFTAMNVLDVEYPQNNGSC